MFTAFMSNVFAREIVLTETNSVSLVGPVTSDSIGEIMYTLTEISQKENPSDPIYLVLNTPGGSVYAGLQLIEYMNTLRRPVLVVANLAVSMGFHILQHSKQRLVTKFATIMSHRASGSFNGDIPQQVSHRLKHVSDLVGKMDEHVISRTGGKYTKESYMELIRDEYYAVGTGAITDGFADEVVSLKCDDTLNKYEERTISMIFMQIKVKISKCPLASLPVAVDQENAKQVLDYFTLNRGLEF
jgi:ATP-dependent Clp protease protease subunit